MLEQLLSAIAPQQIAEVIRTHPHVVTSVLQHFQTVKHIGEALTLEQQIRISANVPRLSQFFQSPEGKSSISLMGEEFCKWIEEDNKVK